MKKTYVHLVSDSTGETIQALSKAIFSQFDGLETKEYTWSLTRTVPQLDKVLNEIRQRRGVVLYTIAEQELKDRLKEFCKRNKLFSLEVLDELTHKVAEHLGLKPNPTIGKQHAIDEQYFKRIEAMNFTITHDDGQVSENICRADIILLGPSRTSKSPTSMYLAVRGFKVANIPLVENIPFDATIFSRKEIFFVGLTISPKRLVEIRKNRLLSMKANQNSNYIDEEAVKREVAYAKKLCLAHKVPVIDVTRRSVEETSALIMQMYYDRKAKEKASS